MILSSGLAIPADVARDALGNVVDNNLDIPEYMIINEDDNKLVQESKLEAQLRIWSNNYSQNNNNNLEGVTNTNNYVTPNSNILNASENSGTNKNLYVVAKDYMPCYIINLNNAKVIEFLSDPDSFSTSNGATYSTQGIRGRSSPFQGYDQSGPRSLNFSIKLYDDLCKDGIKSTIFQLLSLTYPNYGGILKPTVCQVRIGDMINMRAIVNNVDINWQKPSREQLYLQADVSISLTEVVDNPYSMDEIWNSGGYL